MTVYRFKSPSAATLSVLERMHAALLRTTQRVEDPAIKARLTTRCELVAQRIDAYRERVNRLEVAK